MKNTLSQIFIGTVLVVIGFIANIFWSAYQNKVQHLESVVRKSESVLRVAKEIGDSIQFTINEKRINDISEFEIQIFNRTNSDFTDVPLYIDLYDSTEVLPNVISTDFYDQNETKDLIEIAAPKIAKNKLRYGFKINILNRSETKPVFGVKFLIEGNKIPNYKISVSKAGLEVIESKTPNGDMGFSLWDIFFGFGFAYLLINLIDKFVSQKKIKALEMKINDSES
jgi:hypothetical protein